MDGKNELVKSERKREKEKQKHGKQKEVKFLETDREEMSDPWIIEFAAINSRAIHPPDQLVPGITGPSQNAALLPSSGLGLGSDFTVVL